MFDLYSAVIYRTRVNGVPIERKTEVKNNDRILLGNKQFYKISIPKARKSMLEEAAEEEVDFCKFQLNKIWICILLNIES